jgi:hypothetical protein
MPSSADVSRTAGASGGQILWMSFYFSAGVWVSVCIVFV